MGDGRAALPLDDDPRASGRPRLQLAAQGRVRRDGRRRRGGRRAGRRLWRGGRRAGHDVAAAPDLVRPGRTGDRHRRTRGGDPRPVTRPGPHVDRRPRSSGASPTPCSSATGTSCSRSSGGRRSTSSTCGSCASGRSRSPRCCGPRGMVSVFTGTIDDGYGGMLGWFWVACALGDARPRPRDHRRPQGAGVLRGDGGDRVALPGDPHRVRHGPRGPRRC